LPTADTLFRNLCIQCTGIIVFVQVRRKIMEQDQLHHDALQAAQKRLQQYKDGILVNNTSNLDGTDGVHTNSIQSSRNKIQQQQIALAKEYGTKVTAST
jgi:hypothetical protein